MKLSILAGATSQSVNVFVQDSSKTDGSGLAGLVFNTGSLAAYYSFSGANATGVAITLATLATVGTAWSSGGFLEIDATHMKGWYRLDIPNAALATSKGRSVSLHLYGATNMAPCPVEIELTGWDNQDTIHGGMSALPNTACTTNASLLTSGTGTDQVSVSAGKLLLQATQTGVTIPTVTTVTTTTNLTNAATAGDLTATMKTSVTTAATAATPTAAAVTGAVGSVTGAVGSVTGNVGGNVTGTIGGYAAGQDPATLLLITPANLIATDSSHRVTANATQLAGQTITAAAGVTFPTSVASPTNITAGTITTVTNLTNAPTSGDLTPTMKTSVTTAATAATPTVTAGTVSDKTGYSLGATGLNAITVTDPAAVATTFPTMVVQIWRRFFKKSAKDANAGMIITYKDDGTTAETTQTYTDDGAGNETLGAAS